MYVVFTLCTVHTYVSILVAYTYTYVHTYVRTYVHTHIHTSYKQYLAVAFGVFTVFLLPAVANGVVSSDTTPSPFHFGVCGAVLKALVAVGDMPFFFLEDLFKGLQKRSEDTNCTHSTSTNRFVCIHVAYFIPSVVCVSLHP